MLVGGIIILTNARTLLRTFEAPSTATVPAYVIILVVWALAIAVGIQRYRKDPDAAGVVDADESREPEKVPVS